MERKLSQYKKEIIVAEIQTKKATMTQLAEKYGVSHARISQVFKKMTGSALYPHKAKEKQEALVAPVLETNTCAIPLGSVLETISRLSKEYPTTQYTVEINLHEQIISIRISHKSLRYV